MVTNAGVNSYLALVDSQYSGSADGSMDARIGWNTLRVELNPVPVPASILLLGPGLLAIGFMGRRHHTT